MNSKEQTERLQNIASRYEAFYRKSAELILTPQLTGYEPGPSLWMRIKRFLRRLFT